VEPVVTPPTTASSDVLMVRLEARPNLKTAELMPRGPERKTAVWTSLAETAAASQAPLLDIVSKLRASGAVQGVETLVSPNMLIVDPVAGKSRAVIDALTAAGGVKTVYGSIGDVVWSKAGPPDSHTHRKLRDPGWGLDVAHRGPSMSLEELPTAPYGLGMVGAPAAWKLGASGAGLVYGSIDTGADASHEAISAAYRGTQADGSQQHDYNWFDFGAGRSPAPKDPDAHGTHTIGTVTGKAVGVAPSARWISAHGLVGGADVRLKALQWMQAPTKLDGTAPDPALAPDVVGMSWWTGRPHEDFFVDSLRNLLSAGIEPVKSAGNNGNGPETISSPGQHPDINAVAAVGEDGQVAEFSSRGPSPLPHTGTKPHWKPDFAAPGVDVLSSVPGNKYAKYSGTSMAQPHFSGVVLNILSKYPQLNHTQLTSVLAKSAVDAGARGRDLEFGHGIVNLPAALAEAERLVGTKPPARG